MNIEQIHEYALSMEGAEETTPVGDNVIVYKVNNKMFLLLPLNTAPVQFNAKCDPDTAIELRDQYSCIIPGYHMSKKHWNTVIIDGTLTARQLKDFILDSYNLVAPKKKK